MAACFESAPHDANKCVSCTAESRSTSAESRQSGQQQQHQPASGYAPSSFISGLPQYEYPVPLVVRNTFIDTEEGRPVSLDEFFEERQIRSCPPPENDNCEDWNTEDDIKPPESQTWRHAFTAGAEAMMTKVAIVAGFSTGAEYGTSAAPAEISNASQQMPRVLVLSEALAIPEVGSQELPTVGSTGHSVGKCKPCAFFYTKGCGNGIQCPYCHLCPPDEKRRRQKEKMANMREVRQQRKLAHL